MSTTTNRKEAGTAAPATTTEDNPSEISASQEPYAKESKVFPADPFSGLCNLLLQKVDQPLQKSLLLQKWKSRRAFLIAQGQMLAILVVAYIVNNWPVSYPREENHSDLLFWFMALVMGGAAYVSLKHDTGHNRGVQLLSRVQTEEWKGWMQFVFIMYHYYRNRSIYNQIRVLVSAYVWMTGFGHFLYCDKKQDFSVERIVSMWVRINYFPLLLSLGLGVPLELYYVVPLHTVGFFMAFATCYLAKILREKVPQYLSDPFKANVAAIGISLLIHVLFYETSLHASVLGMFSHEYVFRFSTDKYSAWCGLVSGLMWSRCQAYMQWCYGGGDDDDATSSGIVEASEKSKPPPRGIQRVNKVQAMQLQRAAGVALLVGWYGAFGRESDKIAYNSQHAFVFWMPIAGWLMLRNSSKFLTELHSTALEFMGRITLETYVLQFHVFMCRNVQHIPVVIPGSGVKGFAILKFANMIVTGAGFLALAYHARRATVATQNAVTELVSDVRKMYFGGAGEEAPMKTKPTLGIIEDPEEVIPLKGAGGKDEAV